MTPVPVPPRTGLPDPHGPDLPREATTERWVLRGSVVAALLLGALAIGNALGAWVLELRPGEGTGAGPTIDFVALAAIALLLPYGAVRTVHVRRLERVEAQLPELVEDLAESGRHGVPLAESIRVAARGPYGPLSPEVARMAEEVAWGVPVDEVLAGLSERLPTPLVRQAVTVMRRAEASGGRSPEVLARAARDARNELRSRGQRRDAMQTYLAVVALAFGVFLLTIYVLAAIYLPVLVSATGSSSGTPGVFLAGAPVAASLFLALFAAVLAHGIGDGLVAGVMARGRFAEGMVYSAALLLVGWGVLRFLVAPLAGGG